MEMIKIAYLISAYKDPRQLNRMINALYQGNSTFFFIHIDAKCNQHEFEEAISPQLKKISFLPKTDIGYNGEDSIK